MNRLPYARTHHAMREVYGHRVHQLDLMPEPKRRVVQDWALYAVACVAAAVMVWVSL